MSVFLRFGGDPPAAQAVRVQQFSTSWEHFPKERRRLSHAVVDLPSEAAVGTVCAWGRQGVRV